MGDKVGDIEMTNQKVEEVEVTNNKGNKKVNLKIITPRGLKFDEQADMIIMRCVDGNLGVLAGHEPVSAILGDGILSIHNNGTEKKLAVFGGIVEIKDKTVNILTTIAQRPEEIDLERAEQDRQEAEETIMEENQEVQVQSLQVLLRRSLVRIEVRVHMEDAEYYEDGDDEDNDLS